MGADQDTTHLRELLDGYLRHVPPAVNNGSHNLSVQFKQAVVLQRKLLVKRGVTAQELQTGINVMNRFWSMPAGPSVVATKCA